MKEGILRQYVARVQAFQRDAHRILAAHETSPSRVVLLDETYRKLSALSLQQDGLTRQALKCAEYGLFRAAHVMAWAAFMDFLEEKLESEGMTKLKQVRPKWTRLSMEELREEVPEYQLIEASRDVGICTKNQVRALLGLLNKRNECAHPSAYNPDLNQTLGYISELLDRISTLQPKKF